MTKFRNFKTSTLVLLPVLLALMFSSLKAQAEWGEFDNAGAHVFYQMQCSDPTHALFLLGDNVTGSGEATEYPKALAQSITDMFGPLIDTTVATCGVVVAPIPPEHTFSNHTLLGWDVVSDLRYGADIKDIVSSMLLVKLIWDIPVIVVGDGTGGTMVHEVSQYLTSIGKSDLVTAAVMSETVSAQSITPQIVQYSTLPPNATEPVDILLPPVGLSGNPSLFYSVGDYDFYLNGDSWSVAGVPTPNAEWLMPTLVIYSLENGARVRTPTPIKEELALSLWAHGSQTLTIVHGEDRVKDPEWYVTVQQWLRTYLFR